MRVLAPEAEEEAGTDAWYSTKGAYVCQVRQLLFSNTVALMLNQVVPIHPPDRQNPQIIRECTLSAQTISCRP